jgi:hypothetical protein
MDKEDKKKLATEAIQHSLKKKEDLNVDEVTS